MYYTLVLILVHGAAAVSAALDPVPLDSFHAPGAHQGVAVDARHVYAIDNTGIAKYDRFNGGKITEWRAEKEHPLIHMNAGIVHDGSLLCAHSNYPLLPMRSSIEKFDTENLAWTGRHDFGETDGSLTWIDWHAGRWWACFAHYSKPGGDPRKGHAHTRLVQYDENWTERRRWAFPKAALDKFAPYSCSGGAWISDDILLVTGHDNPEALALRLPENGDTLEYIAAVPVPFHGQAIDYNPEAGESVYGIVRSEELVVQISVQDVLERILQGAKNAGE